MKTPIMRRIERMTDQEILEQSKETIDLLRARLKVLEESNESLKQHTEWLWNRLQTLYDRIFSLLESHNRNK